MDRAVAMKFLNNMVGSWREGKSPSFYSMLAVVEHRKQWDAYVIEEAKEDDFLAWVSEIYGKNEIERKRDYNGEFTEEVEDYLARLDCKVRFQQLEYWIGG